MNEPLKPAGPQRSGLRARAEELLAARAGAEATMPLDEVRRLVHELDVHRIELEMQNQELREAQEQLEASRDRYADLFDFAPVGYATLDEHARVVEINLTGSQMLDTPRSRILGYPFVGFVAAGDKGVFFQRIQECRQSGEAVAFEATLQGRGGRRAPVQVRALPCGKPGAASGCRIAMTDVSELRKAREAAEAANRAKSEFLANISHELRTPMNAILGMTEIALQEDISPAVRDHLQTARDSAEVLLSLLNELLDMARIEAGRFTLEIAPLALRALVEETVKSLGVRAQAKGLALTCGVADDVPEAVLGDRMRLRQVLTNLVDNAVKFTDQGEVSVGVAVLNRGDHGCSVRFAVSDTGIGISAENQAKLFKPFTQVESSSARRFGGSGLGLAIAANLVGLMGGRLEVASAAGRGSTFSFTLPLPIAALPAEGPPRTEGGAESGPRGAAGEPAASVPRRILLVEDTPANRKLALYILKKRGHMVEIAENGTQAVELARSRDYDLVLMDVQMPGVDGLEATAAIRGLDDPRRAQVPIIAMTAFAMPQDEARCLEAGMSGYLAKPIDRKTLLDAVDRLARRPT